MLIRLVDQVSQFRNCDLYLCSAFRAALTLSDITAWAAGAGEGPAVHCVQGQLGSDYRESP